MPANLGSTLPKRPSNQILWSEACKFDVVLNCELGRKNMTVSTSLQQLTDESGVISALQTAALSPQLLPEHWPDRISATAHKTEVPAPDFLFGRVHAK